MQEFPALASGLIVRGEGGGDVRGRAGEIDDDFAFQVESGELIEIFFLNLQAVAHENQRRGKSGGGVGEAGTGVGRLGGRKRICFVRRGQGGEGFGIIAVLLVDGGGGLHDG